MPTPVAVLARTYAHLRSEGPVVVGVVARRGRVAASRLRLLAGSATSMLSGSHSDGTLPPQDRFGSLGAVGSALRADDDGAPGPTAITAQNDAVVEPAETAAVDVPPAAVDVPVEVHAPPAAVDVPVEVDAPPAAVDVPVEVDAPVQVDAPADNGAQAEASAPGEMPPPPATVTIVTSTPVQEASPVAPIERIEDSVRSTETAESAEPVRSERAGAMAPAVEGIGGRGGDESIVAPTVPRAETAGDADLALLLGIYPFDSAPARRHALVRGELLVAAGVAAVLLASIMLILAGRDRHESADAGYFAPLSSSTSAQGPTLPQSAAASAASRATIHRHDAIKWMQANLYPTDFIAADAPTAVELRQYGFRHVHAVDGAQHITDKVQFVAVPGDLSAAATTLNTLLAKSTPVATFGTGAAATTVSEVQNADAKSLARTLSKNRTAREAAGRQLSLNSRLTVAPGVLPVISKGSLDLRAETLLALLTQNGDVRLDAAPQDDAERHAHVPIRTVVVTVTSVAKARTTIAGLPAGYHAQSTQDAPGSRLTVQFPVRGVPTMPVS